MEIIFKQMKPNAFKRLVKDGGYIAIRRGVRQGLFKFGNDVMETIDNEVLRTPKTGIVYIVRTASGRRRRHRSSAPGESHANLTGALRKSKDYQMGGVESIEVGYLRDAPIYAKAIEFGNKKGTLKARPTIRTSIRKSMVAGRQHIEKEIKVALNESTGRN